jgi:hypothetical protein
MKPLHRFGLAALAMLASSVTYADDFYLSSSGDSGAPEEINKFTKIDDNTYMLMVERFYQYSYWYSYTYRIGKKTDGADALTYFGPAETSQITSEDLVIGKTESGTDDKGVTIVDYEGINFDISANTAENTLSAKPIEGQSNSSVKSLLLTLTVDDNGVPTSLNIKKPTEHNIPVGLPTYFLVSPYNKQLVKTGAYTYSAHFDKIENQSIVIKDTSKDDGDCIWLGLRLYTQIVQWYEGDNLHLYKTGSNADLFDFTAADGGSADLSSTNGKVNFKIYQGSNKSASTYSLFVNNTALYDVDVTLYYDMLFRNDKQALQEKASAIKADDGAAAASDSDDECYTTTDGTYHVNHIEGKTMFESTSAMATQEQTKNMTAVQVATTFADAYNAQLSISYSTSKTEIDNIVKGTTSVSSTFEIETSNENWSQSIPLKYEKSETITESTANLEAGSYIVYKGTLPGNFDAAFYIQEILSTQTVSDSGESTTSKDTINFKASETAANESNTLIEMPFAVEGNETETIENQEVDAFSPESEVKSTTTDSDDSLPFYLRSVSSQENAYVTVEFYYNYEDPSKSIVIINSTNSVICGAESISVAEENESPVEYFNLNGVRVDGSVPGLYIRRQGNKVTKVIIK